MSHVKTLAAAVDNALLNLCVLVEEDYGGPCLLYTSDAADDLLCVDLGGLRIIKKKNTPPLSPQYSRTALFLSYHADPQSTSHLHFPKQLTHTSPIASLLAFIHT